MQHSEQENTVWTEKDSVVPWKEHKSEVLCQ